VTVAVSLQHQQCDNFDEIQQEKAKQSGAVIYMYCFADFASTNLLPFVRLYQNYNRYSYFKFYEVLKLYIW
jgi:hypothetical protein